MEDNYHSDDDYSESENLLNTSCNDDNENNDLDATGDDDETDLNVLTPELLTEIESVVGSIDDLNDREELENVIGTLSSMPCEEENIIITRSISCFCL